MPIFKLDEFFLNILPKKRLIGIDPGTKTIGVAVSNTDLTVASPITTIKRKKISSDINELILIANHYDIAGLVMGWPLNMDGSESELSRLSRKFARRLQGRFNLEVLMVDERLTSHDAKLSIREAGFGKKNSKIDLTKIDHLAATLILQSWLDQPNLGQQP